MIVPTKRRGPPGNPYRAGDPRWYPTTGPKSLWRVAIPLPGWGLEEQVAHRVWLLIHEDVAVPVPRRFLTTIAEHVWGVHPATIRTVLNNFKVYVKPVVYDSIKRDEKAKDGVVYGPRALTEKERAYLDQLVDLKKTGLPGSVLGAAAENYVRWYFKNERLRHRYRIVTPRKKLGNVIDTYGKNRLDLTVVDLEDQDSMYCVSVKNERDAIENRSKWIGDVIAMSKAHGGKPWLIASFITADGIRACEEQGVRCTAIGARIKPAETSDGRLTGVLIRKLRPILGVEPWRTVFIDRIKSADFDEDFMSRLDTARTV